jgi:hypothetical protein
LLHHFSLYYLVPFIITRLLLGDIVVNYLYGLFSPYPDAGELFVDAVLRALKKMEGDYFHFASYRQAWVFRNVASRRDPALCLVCGGGALRQQGSDYRPIRSTALGQKWATLWGTSCVEN